MYLAIEGIKGCGKSTLLKKVLMGQVNKLAGASAFPITAPMHSSHPFELKFKHCASSQANDDFIERLFLQRAIWNQRRCLHSFIVGDRSIATAIVTRWDKWRDPFVTISRVKKEYQGILRPNVILYIDTPVESAHSNILKRRPKLTGKIDEELPSLIKANDVYKELFIDGLYNKKFIKTQFVVIPYSDRETDICKEISSILKFYNHE